MDSALEPEEFIVLFFSNCDDVARSSLIGVLISRRPLDNHSCEESAQVLQFNSVFDEATESDNRLVSVKSVQT